MAEPIALNMKEHAMHGEYKMPGGKLVVVDLTLAQGALAGVQVSGDFFLEPDTALETINQALNGLPGTSTEAELTAAIDAALGPVVQMYGVSAQAIAVAVRRALEVQP